MHAITVEKSSEDCLDIENKLEVDVKHGGASRGSEGYIRLLDPC